MQYSFSLNNFGVSPSASNPADGVSEAVLSLSHQRGKKNKKQNKQKNKTKYPKFKCNTVSVRPSACSSSSVVLSSKEEKKKRVWRQFCEWLSEAVAHLPTAVSQLLLEALLIADLRSELNTHLAPPGFVYLEFSWA
jgi:hypothetical protein